MEKSKLILNLLLIIAVTAIVIVALVESGSQNPPQNFSVSATGKVFAKADVANLTLGFKTEVKPTAAEAVNENAEKMNQIIKELKALNIQAKDIKTTDYSLNPVYDWTRDDGQRLKGYQVSQKVSLKIRDLDKIGQVIVKTAAQGANQIGGVSFTIDDEDELKSQARDEAIAKAKQKATAIAQVSGLKLGKVVNVIENQFYYPRAVYNKRLDYAIGGADEIEIPQIETGENEVRVEVTVVYEVK